MIERVRAGRLLILALLLVFPACVKKSTYNRALDDIASARRQLDVAREDATERERRLSEELESVRGDLAIVRDSLARVRGDVRRLEGELETERGRSRRLEMLLDERGAQTLMLQERIRALSAIEREVRERNRIFEDVISRFRSLIDAGQLSVSIANGRMVIHLPQDVLFQSGSATLSRDGVETVTRVGQVLAQIPDRRFQVEGHTDNVPIATQRFPSNWELSAARSLAVVHLLQRQGVPPGSISGAAYGEHQPVQPNDQPDGRRANRRIEVVMLPNLDVIAELNPGGA